MRNSKNFLLLLFVVLAYFFVVCTVSTHSPGDVSLSNQLPRDVSPSDASPSSTLESVADNSICVMTVFIHGTVGSHFSFKALGGWLKSLFTRKKKRVGVYQQYIEQVKRYSFHRYQPINGLGLVSVDLDTQLCRDDVGYMAVQTASLYKKVYDEAYADHKNDVRFYTFGWSGRLNKKMRRAAATDLYDELYDEAERLHKETGKPVAIWLLAHSHGVNVCLNLEEEEKVQKRNLCIDKGIFFGGPVQSETEELVKNSVFKNMYNIYSRGDHIQRLDCLSTKDWFSRQTFGTDKKQPIDVPDNLSQIEVCVGSCKPYHYELWLWGRKTFPYFFYRKRLSLYPLPVSIFSPIIVFLADEVDLSADTKNLCSLRIDGKEGEFALYGAGQRVCQVINIALLKQEGHAAL